MEYKGYSNVRSLLYDLNRYNEVLFRLFGRRSEWMPYEDLLSLVEGDAQRIEQLERRTLIEGDSSRGYALDSRIIDFFEQFLEIEEDIHPEAIMAIVSNLQDQINYHNLATNARQRDRYLLAAQRNLQKLGKTALRHTSSLHFNVKLVYETESNLEIKQQKLKDIRKKRDAIEELINQVQTQLDNDAFYQGVAGQRLQTTIQYLKQDLLNARKYLIEVQQHILDYLNRSLQLSNIFEKIQRVKRLKDKHELLEQSNLEEMMEERQEMFFQNVRQHSLWLNPEDLQEVDAENLILKVGKRLESQHRKQVNSAGPLGEEDIQGLSKIADNASMSKIKSAFLAQEEDLFRFVLDLELEGEEEHAALNTEQRIGLYCKLASLYADEMLFTSDFGRYEHYEYAVIHPGLSA